MVLRDKAGLCLTPSPKAMRIPESYFGEKGRCEGLVREEMKEGRMRGKDKSRRGHETMS